MSDVATACGGAPPPRASVEAALRDACAELFGHAYRRLDARELEELLSEGSEERIR
jgi:hypothetical protein